MADANVADVASVVNGTHAARNTHDALPGLVLWPTDAVPRNRLCVLISDTHCTDCSVGNQTASESDWQLYFERRAACVTRCSNVSAKA